MLYLFTIDVNVCHAKLLMVYHIQIFNIKIDDKNMTYTIKKYSIA